MTATVDGSIDRIFGFETKSVREAEGHFVRSGIPRIYANVRSPFWFDTRSSEISRSSNRDFDISPEIRFLKPYELALVTIQENGSAPEGYVPIGDAHIFQKPLIVGARQGSSHLVVGDSTYKNREHGHIIRAPALLSFQDFIAYEVLKRFD